MEIIEMKDSMEFKGFYLIKSAEVKTARNGKNYLDLIVQDKTGQIGGKLWGSSAKDEETYKAGVVVYIEGTRSSYNGTVR